MEFINSHTKESIDMDYVLGKIFPRTPYGLQKKRELKPFMPGEEQRLEQELDEVEAFIKIMESYDQSLREISHVLSNIKEIRTSISRAGDGIILDEVEFFEIKNFIMDLRDISREQRDIQLFPEDTRIDDPVFLRNLLDPEGLDNRTFYIYDSYSEKLKTIRERKNMLQRQLEHERKKIVSQIQECLGVIPRLSGEIAISKKDEDMLRRARECLYIIEEGSTTLTTTFRSRKNEDILNLQEEIESLKLLEEQEEYRVKKALSEEIGKNSRLMFDMTERIGRLDLLIAKAEFSRSINGTRPLVHQGKFMSIKNGRHIKLEFILEKQGKKFAPLTLYLSHGVTVITGANMGGKTIGLKLVGMLAALVQFGLYVPAEEVSTCLYDYIYFSIGDMQSIDSGLSTFGGEVSGMIDILRCSELGGLILIDELARGTNPEEGYAISRAIVKFLKDRDSITLFTTHFAGITREYGIQHLKVRGLKNVDFDEVINKHRAGISGIDLVLEHMDYTLERVEGKYNAPRDAINIARLMGLDEKILKYAEEIMNSGREE